jgi:hypothetical protein
LFFSGSVLIGIAIAYWGVEKDDFEETIVAAYLIWTTAILLIMICVDLCMSKSKMPESVCDSENTENKISYEP